jgi:hypothetical protein
MIEDKLAVEMDILRKRMKGVAKRRQDLECLRNLMSGYAGVESR